MRITSIFARRPTGRVFILGIGMLLVKKVERSTENYGPERSVRRRVPDRVHSSILRFRKIDFLRQIPRDLSERGGN